MVITWCCCCVTRWIYGKSVLLKLWTSSSTISSRTNCHLAFECAPLNWYKKHNNASRKTYSFFEVKLRQFLKKTWTKINKIFVFKKQHTVNILCLQFKWNIRSPPAWFVSAVSLFLFFIFMSNVFMLQNQQASLVKPIAAVYTPKWCNFPC